MIYSQNQDKSNNWSNHMSLGWLGEPKTNPLFNDFKELKETHEIVFVNYKNSMLGVGGVGTVTRAVLNEFPNMQMVCFDPRFDDYKNKNVHNVPISNSESKLFHSQYAKLHLWPILHNIPTVINDRDLRVVREIHEEVSDKFAQRAVNVSKKLKKESIFWVNDYNLTGVVKYIRKYLPESRIAFSLRTPFGVNNKPMFEEKDLLTILTGMLAADIISFHRERDVIHFLEVVDGIFRDSDIVQVDWTSKTVRTGDRIVVPRSFPMGNSPQYRRQLAISKKSEEYKKYFGGLCKTGQVITSVSRFDKTKGVEYELNTIEKLLQYYPEIHKKFTFLRVSYLSDTKKDTKYYSSQFDEVMKKITTINAKYSKDGWEPIVPHFERKLTDIEMTGLYRATDILFIASLGDGFNHISVESIQSKTNIDNPLHIITTNIGATDYLEGFSLVSAADLTGTVKEMYNAITENYEVRKINHKKLYSTSSNLFAENWFKSIILATINLDKLPIVIKS